MILPKPFFLDISTQKLNFLEIQMTLMSQKLVVLQLIILDCNRVGILQSVYDLVKLKRVFVLKVQRVAIINYKVFLVLAKRESKLRF